MEKIRYCPECGFQNKEDSKFCENCGYQFQEKQENKSPSKKRTPLVIGIIAIICVGAIIGMYFGFIERGEEEITPSTPAPETVSSTPAQTTPAPTETPTPLPKIGDKVISGSIQVSVLRAEKTHSISSSAFSNDVTINSKEGFILLPITVELENIGETSVELTLAPESTVVWDAQRHQYLLEYVGYLFKDSIYLVYGSSGQMSVEPPDKLWKLTGDFTNNVWIITLMAESHVEVVLVYSVPINSSGFKLSLPGFTPIRIDN